MTYNRGMADTEKSIKINIDVIVNEAKRALGDISATTEKVTKQLNTLGKDGGKGLDTFNKSAGAAASGANKFFDSTTTSVLKGLASYDLLRKGAGLAFDFIASSVQESMEAARIMAQVKVNVENAGLSYEKIGPQLDAYSAKMIKMGFDDESTAESVSKLITVTGSYDKALKLNQLAMDLARAKNIDLSTATRLVTQVSQGNTKELKLMGIELDENSSAADNLSKMQDKLKGSASAFADTVPGKLAVLNEEWANMKQEIGDALVPAMLDLLKVVEENLPAIEALAKGVATFAGVVAKSVGFVVGAAEDFGWFLGNVINKIEGLPTVEKEAVKATDDLAESVDKASTSFDGIGTASKASAQELNKQEALMQKLEDAYTTVMAKSEEFAFNSTQDFARFTKVLADTKSDQEKWTKSVTQGFDAFRAKIKSTNDDIESLNKKLADAEQAFKDFLSTTEKESGASFAQIVHDAEKAIPDLQKQINEAAAGGQDTSDLQKQLQEKQSIVASAQQTQYQSNKSFVDELAFLRTQDNKNELDQAFALTQRKIEQRRLEKEATIAGIQEQIKKREEERDAYLTAQTAMTLAFEQNVKARQKTSQQEIASLDALTSAVQRAADAYSRMAANAAYASSRAATTPLVTGRAQGGPVAPGQTYMVGEDGPEMFSPSVGGTITSSDKVSVRGSGVTINIHNPVVRDQQDITELAEALIDILNRRQELTQFGAYK